MTTEITRPNFRAFAWTGAMKMARRGENIPASQLLDFPREEERQDVREFDLQLGCWVLPEARISVPERRPGPAPVPYNDGSGTWWIVRDRETGFDLWTVEARDWRGALAEKRRLCALSGGRSRDAVLIAAR